MADRVPLSLLYRQARERVTALVEGLDDDRDGGRPVPATPGWTVHDVVAHLAGVAEDRANGVRLDKGPTPEWTSAHVQRGRGVPTRQLLDLWARHAPAVEAVLDKAPVWPLVMDATAHEHDIRGAVGDSSARDSAGVVVGAKVLLASLQVPAALRVVTEDHDVQVGPDADDGTRVLLRTSTFEAFRWRLGRRSAHQLASMDWSEDPTPFLPHLCVFGPADHDVLE
jgi:uncharacterized protein (TIGR03083 family)